MPRSTRSTSVLSQPESPPPRQRSSVQRSLPSDRNEMIAPDIAPSHEILVERRCLGQTELKVRPGQVGTSNSTRPSNLGVLDYAHLRVPLPPNLAGSGIFSRKESGRWPDSYFLMRRSEDGFISATGMFKAAFPRASAEEEAAEKEHIKHMKEASSDEVAGNIWIHPDAAVALAKDYGIEIWIGALLSPEPITHGTSHPDKAIKSPPQYRMKEDLAQLGRTPERKSAAADARKSMRGARSRRSLSPTKTPSRKMATPRRPRKGRSNLTSVDETNHESAEDAINGEKPSQQDTVKVEVTNTVEPTANGELEMEKTKLSVEMPVGSPELPLPNDMPALIKQAKAMVDEANAISSGPSKRKGKRKAQEVADEDDEQDDDAVTERASKRARIGELEIRKERIKRRALTGIAATMALGALLPTILTAFGAGA